MSENTNIEWCDHTFNPWEGCQKVGPGCDHCYAETRNARFNGGQAVNWGPGAPRRRTSDANWRKPMQWQAKASEFMAQHGRRQRVFCASLADVFDNQAPEQWRVDLMQLIADTPDLDWLLLTKRIGNAHAMLNAALSHLSHGLTAWDDVPWPNVWIGATVVNQAEADRDIPKLLAVPARVRFLSMEPLRGQVNLRKLIIKAAERPERGQPPVSIDALRGWFGGAGDPARIDWIIVGSESGPGARPMHPDWARSLRDQCQATDVPFLFKQWGEWLPKSSVGVWTGPKTRDYPWEGVSMLSDGRICMRERPISECLELRRKGQRHFPAVMVDSEALKAFHAGDESYQWMFRVGKKDAGRLLDGVEHNGFPGGA